MGQELTDGVRLNNPAAAARPNYANATSFMIPFVGSLTGGAVVNTTINLQFP